MIKSIPCRLRDLQLLETPYFGDPRGYFSLLWNQSMFESMGIRDDFVQDNISLSQANVLRGLHYQIQKPQGKLIRVLSGRVFDVAVDLRRSSPTFGQWDGFWLSGENRLMAWIPPGFAHGFYVPEGEAVFYYKCSNDYAPEWERCIRWDDPQLAIAWPLPGGEPPLLSPKDERGVAFGQAECFP
ncbi:MAG: dTDP-4-dehydrorhamnose 3,5-epimerase [Magnetococcales bacterium]|nr:dTDP-4-dehydrorhamnose 3,5-epimerase [Magnetococcales bacterium]